MHIVGKPILTRRRSSVAVAMAVAALPAMAAGATTDNWIGGSSDWNTPANWDSGKVPGAGDTVNVINTLGLTQTISYDYAGPPVTLGTLTINATGGAETVAMTTAGLALSAISQFIGNSGGSTVGGFGVLTQSAGRNYSAGNLVLGNNALDQGIYLLSGSGWLSVAGNEYIANSGSGAFNQAGGTNVLATENYLILGNNAGSTGTYVLSGSGSLSAGGTDSSEYVGYNGNGIFMQNGGTNTFDGNNGINGVQLGYSVGSSGSYILAAGSLSVNGQEYVGFSGNGSFNQSGGINVISSGFNPYLYLGYNSGSTGTYVLSGSGSLSVGMYEYVGYSGTGSFNQLGGTQYITNALFLGGAASNYSLSAGSLFLGVGSEFVGISGTANFIQTGGVNTINSSLEVGAGGNGEYFLSGSGSLSAAGEYIGYSSAGIFNQSGGTNSVITALNVGGTGLPVSGLNNPIGTYLLSGAGTLMVGNSEYVGYYAAGNFNQSGGVNIANGILIVGGTSGYSANYSLGGGLLRISGADSTNTSEFIGYYGCTGTFTQSGGTNVVASSLQIGYQLGATGSYSLSGTGSLMVSGVEYLGDHGYGSFDQSGGLNSITGSITTQSGATAGLLIASNTPWMGSYVLSAGSLYAVFDEMIGEGGTGTFTQTGGDNLCVADVILGHVAGNGTYNMSGGTLEAPVLGLGDYIKTKGNFNLSGSAMVTISGNEGIGSNKNSSASTSGNFNQTGGLNIAGSMGIGNSSNAFGTYSISGGTLKVNGAMTLTGTHANFNATGGIATVGSVTNGGTVVVGVGASSIGNLTVYGNYNQSAGLTDVDGLLMFANGGSFVLSGGTLKGTGTINGPIFNVGGNVSPGDSPGQLTIAGNYNQSGSGVFDILLGGYTPAVNYSVLSISGSAALGGKMEVDLVGGFVPNVGDRFTFLTAGLGLTGGFNGFTSNNGLFTYTTDYGQNNNVVEITVTSVPEPGCAAGIVMLTGLIVMRRRRNSRKPADCYPQAS